MGLEVLGFLAGLAKRTTSCSSIPLYSFSCPDTEGKNLRSTTVDRRSVQDYDPERASEISKLSRSSPMEALDYKVGSLEREPL